MLEEKNIIDLSTLKKRYFIQHFSKSILVPHINRQN